MAMFYDDDVNDDDEKMNGNTNRCKVSNIQYSGMCPYVIRRRHKITLPTTTNKTHHLDYYILTFKSNDNNALSTPP